MYFPPLHRAEFVPPTVAQRAAMIRRYMTELKIDHAAAERALDKHLAEDSREMWKSSLYTVTVNRNCARGEGWPPMAWLSIRRNDREAIHDWRHMQLIKNQIVGEECEAVELYPAESRLVDTANQYHLWCFEDHSRFPFGFDARLVSGEVDPELGAVQRPLEAKV